MRPDRITPREAIEWAEHAARQWYADKGIAKRIADYEAEREAAADEDKQKVKWPVFVVNDGTASWITGDEAPGVLAAWRGKADWNGFERRASQSSGEAKIDLKFAYPGIKDASFNYHVRFQADPAIEEARLAKAAHDKEVARKFKEDQEKIAKAKAEAEAAGKAAKVAEAARMVRVNLRVNKEWNTYKGTGAYKKTDVEKTWKEKWIKEKGHTVK